MIENAPGLDIPAILKPANTSAAAIYTVPTGVSRAQLIGMNIAALAAANASVFLNDGSTDYELVPTFAMGANTFRSETFGYPVLLAGYSLKVQTSSANNMSFYATVREFIR